MIRFLCPEGHRLIVPDHRAGKKGRCPTCQQKVLVPVPEPVPSDLLQKQQGWVLVDMDLQAPLGFDDRTPFANEGPFGSGTSLS